MWPEDVKLDGRAEIYLHWKNLGILALVMLVPLVVALFFESFVIKIICWGLFLSAGVPHSTVVGHPAKGRCFIANFREIPILLKIL